MEIILCYVYVNMKKDIHPKYFERRIFPAPVAPNTISALLKRKLMSKFAVVAIHFTPELKRLWT